MTRQARPRSRAARLHLALEALARDLFSPMEWTGLAFAWGLAIGAAAFYRP